MVGGVISEDINFIQVIDLSLCFLYLSFQRSVVITSVNIERYINGLNRSNV